MSKKTELEQTIQYGISGPPQIKAEEKRKWLGEFRERVILGLTIKQAVTEEGQYYVEEALKDKAADSLIVNQKIPMATVSKYMQIAKKMKKDFKTLASPSPEAMGIVVISRQAVHKDKVEVDFKKLPKAYKNTQTKNLCQSCYKDLAEQAPEHKSKFKSLSIIDRILGKKCGSCNKK